MVQLSEYEKQRLENIRKNQEILAKLNIASPIAANVKLVSKRPHVKLEPKSRGKSDKEEGDEPIRRSQRIQEKILDDLGGEGDKKKRKKEAASVTISPKANRTVTRQKSIVGAIPFAPQVGATEDFFELMKDIEGKNHTSADDYREDWELALPHAITKVLRSRIYSIAVHPSMAKKIIAVGGKQGELAIWDATQVVEECESCPTITDFSNINDQVYGTLPPFRSFEPRVFVFQPHNTSEGSSVSNLKYQSSYQLLSTCYDGSIRCMDINKGVFDDLYSGDDLINGLDGGDKVWWFSHGLGIVSRLDMREAAKPATFHLHGVKIGTVSVNNNSLCTASNDRSLCLWDIRHLKPEDNKHLWNYECGRAVTAAYINPNDPSLILSTSYDDHVLVHSIKHPSPLHTIKHNNQTGRWITPFKAVWTPRPNPLNYFTVGSMDKSISIFTLNAQSSTPRLDRTVVSSPMLTSQPAVNAFHPERPEYLIASGNASGKIVLWTRKRV